MRQASHNPASALSLATRVYRLLNPQARYSATYARTNKRRNAQRIERLTTVAAIIATSIALLLAVGIAGALLASEHSRYTRCMLSAIDYHSNTEAHKLCF